MSETISNIVRFDKRAASVAELHVDVIADLICPFCYLGKRRLDAAMRAGRKAQLGVLLDDVRSIGFKRVAERTLYRDAFAVMAYARSTRVKRSATSRTNAKTPVPSPTKKTDARCDVARIPFRLMEDR